MRTQEAAAFLLPREGEPAPNQVDRFVALLDDLALSIGVGSNDEMNRQILLDLPELLLESINRSVHLAGRRQYSDFRRTGGGPARHPNRPNIRSCSRCSVTDGRHDTIEQAPLFLKQASDRARQRVVFSQRHDARTPALLYVDDPGEGQAIKDRADAARIQARLTRDGCPTEPGSSGGQHTQYANVPLSSE